MNYIDIGIIAVLMALVLWGYFRGLVRTVFRLASVFISVLLTVRLYPYVGGYLRQTALYGWLRDFFINSLNLRAVFQEQADIRQGELIGSLALPEPFREALQSFNTPDVYELLNVKTIEDYIGGFFANIALHFIAMALVFIVLLIVMGLLGGVLDAAARLPVLNLVNRAGGLAAGLLIGVAVVWAGLSLARLFFSGPEYAAFTRMIDDSRLARAFLEYNWMLDSFSKV
jgi:uncharacterized membrane protein required for colicin V production